MKTKFLIFALIFSLLSCTEEEFPTGAIFTKTYLSCYITPTTVSAQIVQSGVGLSFSMDSTISSLNEEFNVLSEYYGDTFYNRMRVPGAPYNAVNDSISNIKVITISEFDAQHPAESDVADLMECRYVSSYDFIKSGYKNKEVRDWKSYSDLENFMDIERFYNCEGAKLRKEMLTNINYGNTKLIGEDLILSFKKEPETKGIYPFKVIIQLSSKTLETEFKYEF